MLEFLQKNFLLVAAAVGSGAMLLWPLLRGVAGGGGASVNTLQATQLMNRENALVLDLREPAAYAAGHILGAKNLPLAEIEKRAADFEKYKS
ncbi:MAG: rhodanese-like domain-containing protein, partial [Burkholderiales bacterium]